MADVAHADHDQGPRGMMPDGKAISPAKQRARPENCEGCTVCDLPLEGQEGDLAALAQDGGPRAHAPHGLLAGPPDVSPLRAELAGEAASVALRELPAELAGVTPRAPIASQIGYGFAFGLDSPCSYISTKIMTAFLLGWGGAFCKLGDFAPFAISRPFSFLNQPRSNKISKVAQVGPREDQRSPRIEPGRSDDSISRHIYTEIYLITMFSHMSVPGNIS